ncbi:MAG: signal peptidase I [Bacteroidales bacterium]|nr:signal peptidase I [Bacteroidales bacterium]MCF8337075.1 signal peptidase I [Bacteroidales bacterium]
MKLWVYIKRWVKWPLFFLVVFLLAILCRIFLFGIYTIPSGSMKNTLLPGDMIFVNKIIYGPAIPKSLHDVPWLKVFAKSPRNVSNNDVTKLEGFKKISRNDVVVFKPPGKKQVYVKRCVGLPGDRIKLEGDNLLINNRLITSSGNIFYEYLIYFNQKVKMQKFVKNEHQGIVRISDSIGYASVSKDVKTQLMRKSAVDSVKLKTQSLKKQGYNNLYEIDAFKSQKNERSQFVAYGRKNNWNTFDFGPLYIPAEGETISLNLDNVEFYRKIIEQYGNHSLRIENGEIYIDNKKSSIYEFKQNYYFMLGDNRHRSKDSRTWGFVPENRIIGKVVMILYSCNKGKMNWERTLKSINK